jgi:hypothetical protein
MDASSLCFKLQLMEKSSTPYLSMSLGLVPLVPLTWSPFTAGFCRRTKYMVLWPLVMMGEFIKPKEKNLQASGFNSGT